MQTATSLTLRVSWQGVLHSDCTAMHNYIVLTTLLLLHIHVPESIFTAYSAMLALMFWASAVI